MICASALTETMRTPDGGDKRDGNPNAIYAIVMDDTNVHCMTEPMLDTWWDSLSPSDKGCIYERFLDAETDESAAVEELLQSMRNPLERIVAAGEIIAARYAQPLHLEAPTFCATETAFLRRSMRCNRNHNATQTPTQ